MNYRYSLYGYVSHIFTYNYHWHIHYIKIALASSSQPWQPWRPHDVQGRLTEEQIEKMIREAEEFADEDKKAPRSARGSALEDGKIWEDSARGWDSMRIYHQISIDIMDIFWRMEGLLKVISLGSMGNTMGFNP